MNFDDHFQGPGLDPSIGTGGVSHHGGKWPGRLASLCGQITGEFEDEEMELYRNDDRTRGESFSSPYFLCREWKRTLDEETGMFEFLCRNLERWVE